MLNLEELTLYIDVSSFKIFIDGNNLKENIINHLSRLNKFLFNILSIMHLHMKPYLPTNEEIENTFSNFTGNKIISSVEYFPIRQSGQCRIYTYPFTINNYARISNNFSGGLFKYVHEISLFDEHHFEHEFFIRIAQSFPFLK
ncbi:unnamed protein product, partial [Rotaria sp. Silwood2]